MGAYRRRARRRSPRSLFPGATARLASSRSRPDAAPGGDEEKALGYGEPLRVTVRDAGGRRPRARLPHPGRERVRPRPALRPDGRGARRLGPLQPHPRARPRARRRRRRRRRPARVAARDAASRTSSPSGRRARSTPRTSGASRATGVAGAARPRPGRRARRATSPASTRTGSTTRPAGAARSATSSATARASSGWSTATRADVPAAPPARLRAHRGALPRVALAAARARAPPRAHARRLPPVQRRVPPPGRRRRLALHPPRRLARRPGRSGRRRRRRSR